MMKTPKVSVIIPAFNSEQFIEETINSILKQTYKDFEIIVVDDGSKDGTPEVLEKYKDNLVYVRKKNEGISLARNQGIKRARGEYIAFIDHDDLWLPEKLRKQVALLESDKNIGLCYSDAYVIDENKKRNNRLFEISPPQSGMVRERLFKENFIPILTAVVRRSVIDKTGLFDPKYKIAEDWDFFLRVAKRYKIGFINEPLAEYRIHRGSFSRQKDLAVSEAISIIDTYINHVEKFENGILKRRKEWLQFDLGMVYLHKGMKKKAREHFRLSIKKKPVSVLLSMGFLASFLPNTCVKILFRILSTKGLHGLDAANS